jgi:S-adenosylmethionine:tRNA ribosyltransferase-isomerase
VRIDLFDYELPEELIAQASVRAPDASRLMTLKRDGSVSHGVFADIADLLPENALLVLNDTRVIRRACSVKSQPADAWN